MTNTQLPPARHKNFPDTILWSQTMTVKPNINHFLGSEQSIPPPRQALDLPHCKPNGLSTGIHGARFYFSKSCFVTSVTLSSLLPSRRANTDVASTGHRSSVAMHLAVYSRYHVPISVHIHVCYYDSMLKLAAVG
jgi:hypothetical protein